MLGLEWLQQAFDAEERFIFAEMDVEVAFLYERALQNS